MFCSSSRCSFSSMAQESALQRPGMAAPALSSASSKSVWLTPYSAASRFTSYPEAEGFSR